MVFIALDLTHFTRPDDRGLLAIILGDHMSMSSTSRANWWIFVALGEIHIDLENKPLKNHCNLSAFANLAKTLPGSKC